MRTMKLVYIAGPFSADDGWGSLRTSTEPRARRGLWSASVRCPSPRTASALGWRHRDPGVLARGTLELMRRADAVLVLPAREPSGPRARSRRRSGSGCPVPSRGDEPNFEASPRGSGGVTHGRLPDPAQVGLSPLRPRSTSPGASTAWSSTGSVRESSWYIRIYTDTDDHLYSAKLVVNVPLGHRSVDPRMPAGTLMATDTTGRDLEPTLDESTQRGRPGRRGPPVLQAL